MRWIAAGVRVASFAAAAPASFVLGAWLLGTLLAGPPFRGDAEKLPIDP